MARKILMPKLGLTMTEGLVAEWMIPVGSPFKPEQGLFVVETDKAATEIPAEGSGVLTEIIVPAGQTVKVGEVLGYWQDDAEGVAAQSPGAARAPAPVPEPAGRSAAPPRIPVTPLARRIAQRMRVDLAIVHGSGPGGRIKAADVQSAASHASRRVPAQPAPQPAVQQPILQQPAASVSRAKPDPVQAAMARRLTAVKQQVPHFYLSVEADASRLQKLRAELNALGGAVRFTLNHFIVAAVGRALHDLPQANRVWDEGEILSFPTSDVGVAVNTEHGLYVPVVRNAGAIPLTDVARQAQALAEQARNGALSAGDMSGGAIAVSNAGMFHVKFMTPIINPGHAMILGVGSVDRVFRPDDEGRPVLREEMGLVLAGDHRLMDGVSGLKFLNQVVAYLEQPMKLLIGS